MTATPARSWWARAHDPVPGVPAWARRTAYAIPLIVLPSSLWRIAAITLHLPLDAGLTEAAGASGGLPGWLPLEIFVIVLSVVSELVAFTAVGLVAGWGEVFPGWVPVLRGRRVPARCAVVPGWLGAGTLTVLWAWSVATLAFGGDAPIDSALTDAGSWQGMALIACYAPLVVWGPLLALLVLHYQRRRGLSG